MQSTQPATETDLTQACVGILTDENPLVHDAMRLVAKPLDGAELESRAIFDERLNLRVNHQESSRPAT